MKLKFKENTRTIIYASAAGIISFLGYLLTGGSSFFYLFTGPPLYLAYYIKSFFISILGFKFLQDALPAPFVNDFIFLMPVHLLYFTLIGCLITRLKKELGFIRPVSMGVLVLFLAYIHFVSWDHLSGYLASHP